MTKCKCGNMKAQQTDVCEWKLLESYITGFKMYNVGCKNDPLHARYINYEIKNDTCSSCGKKIKEVRGNDK